MKGRDRPISGTAAVLSLSSGAVMIVSGFTSHALILETLIHGAQGLQAFILQSVTLLFGSFLILSGIFFVLGGLMLLVKHYSFGRPLVALAGGLGIFTLAFCLVLAYINSGFFISSSLLLHPEYFVGIGSCICINRN